MVHFSSESHDAYGAFGMGLGFGAEDEVDCVCLCAKASWCKVAIPCIFGIVDANIVSMFRSQEIHYHRRFENHFDEE